MARTMTLPSPTKARTRDGTGIMRARVRAGYGPLWSLDPNQGPDQSHSGEGQSSNRQIQGQATPDQVKTRSGQRLTRVGKSELTLASPVLVGIGQPGSAWTNQGHDSVSHCQARPGPEPNQDRTRVG